MHKKKTKLKGILFPIGVLFIFLGVWQLVDYLFKIKEVILPSPVEIFNEIINNFSLLINHTSITMFESLMGFIFGSVLGILIALSFVYYPLSKKAFYPYAIALKATPLYALAPLLVIWFGNDLWSKIVMSSMVAFFPVLVSSVKGFSSVGKEKLELFQSLSASKWDTFVKLKFPHALSYIFPSLKIATTLAVVGATIAEFTGASRGIGHLIVNSSYYLETSLMFAAIIFISIAGVLFFYLLDYLEKKVVFWHSH